MTEEYKTKSCGYDATLQMPMQKKRGLILSVKNIMGLPQTVNK